MDAKSVSQDPPKPEDQPKPQEPIPTHRGVGAWLLWLFLTPVVYVLSTGPISKLDQALNLSQKAPSFEHILATVYSPIDWCTARSTPFCDALSWYLFRVWKLEPKVD